MLSQLKSALNSHILSPIGLQLVSKSILPAGYFRSTIEPKPKRILFIHPPKCGGTSVVDLLQRAFGVGEELSPFASRQAAEKLGISMQEVRQVILAYQVYRPDAPLIFGHYWFSETVLRDKAEEFDLITILRDPRHRLLSQYYYNRYKKKQSHFGIDCNLEEWLESPNASYHANIYSQIFAGLPETNPANNANSVSPGNTDRAIQNLKMFTIIGILEKQDELAAKLNTRYGIKSQLGRERPNPKQGYPSYLEQPSHIQHKIDMLCSEDTRLYRTFYSNCLDD